MDTEKKEKLVAAGVNVDSALKRFMNSEKMLNKYLNRFLEEKSFEALTAAIASGDKDAAVMAAHTFKSVCGTLGCEKIQALAAEQEADFRHDKWDEAVALMPAITEEYQKVCVVLKALQPLT